ncbi:hypothetical protein H0H93_008744 [Arthromyces matolae]|nr:hypothetical protein H0H93_008744 [Arthromyces matolae]
MALLLHALFFPLLPLTYVLRDLLLSARLAQSARASDFYGGFSKELSEGCEFDPRGGLCVVNKQECYAEYVELGFQDQYLGRNDMWRLGKELVGQCIHADQHITFVGNIAAKIQGIYIDGKPLWEFAGDGERYYEKIVHSFLPSLFQKWREAGTNHTVTIVLISRVFYEESEITYAAGPLRQDDYGKWYKDFFKVITDLEVINEWKPTLVSLKDSFWDFQRDILLTHHYHQSTLDESSSGPFPQVRLIGRISYAHDGPVLEAINLALNPTETHYIDRSLSLTGTTTIILSPGTGYFKVSKDLLRLTTTRLLDQGFVVQFVSLAKPPLHQSPVFSFRSTEPKPEQVLDSKNISQALDPLWGAVEKDGEMKTFWWEPFWVTMTFWDKQLDLPFRTDRFIGRARMGQIQMLGLLELDVLSSIEVPFLPENPGALEGSSISTSSTPHELQDDIFPTQADADKFDMDIFALRPESKAVTITRDSVISTTSNSSTAMSFRHPDKRAQRNSAAIARIDTIEESPNRVIVDLPPENSPEKSRNGTSYHNGGRRSPSQSSIMSLRSNLSASSSKNRSSTVAAPKATLASKLAPAWLFNPFRTTPVEPETSPISASSTSHTPIPASEALTKQAIPSSPIRMPLSHPAAAQLAHSPLGNSPLPVPVAIRKSAASTRSSTGRTFEDDALLPQRAHYPRRSPVGTPPREEAIFAKRRSEMKSFLVKPPVAKGSLEEWRRAWALAVMRGMAAVRLAQGFQFVLRRPTKTDGVDDRMALRRLKSLIADDESPKCIGASDVLRSPDDPVYLSMTNEIHRISYTGEAIQVRRYVRRMPIPKPFQYQCLMWPKLGGGYTELSTKFESHGLENYGWNRLDMLVAGYEHNFNESLRYWRTRFIVIPSSDDPEPISSPNGEKLNEEEIRLTGIEKLAEMFTKLRWQPPEERISHPAPPVRILPTTLGPSLCVRDAALMEQLDQLHAAGPLRKKMKSEREIGEMSLAAIAKAMREDGGVPFKDYQWHRSFYPNSFTGYDMVSWLVREFRDISSRSQAAEFGVKLLEQGLFEHCRHLHNFLDGHYIYRLKGDYSVASPPKGWFRRYTMVDEPRASYYPSSVARPSNAGPRKHKRRILLSQSMVIDIDPNKKSDQAESVILHHDLIHNPGTVFHFELQWIGTTARCIEDLIRQWGRTVEKYGLKLVEAYVTQISDIRDRNAFQSCFPMRFAVQPPFVMGIESYIPEGTHSKHYFEYQLLKKFGYILDVEAASMYPEQVDVVYSYRRSPFKYSQFVHKSGLGFVQVLGGSQGFVFLTNRLMGPARTEKNKGYKTLSADDIRIELYNFVSDKKALEDFYQEETILLMENNTEDSQKESHIL